MRLLRLTLTDFRSYAALTWRPRARIAVLFGPNGSGKTNLLEAVSLLVPGRGLRGARNADLRRHGAADGWAVAGRFATAQGETDIGTGTPPGAPAAGAAGPATAGSGASPSGASPSGASPPGAAGSGASLSGASPSGASPSGARVSGARLSGGVPAGSQADRRVFRLDGAAPRSQAEIAARVAAVWVTPQMDRLFQEGLSGRRRFLDRLVWALEPGHAREIAAYEAAMGSRNRLLAEGRLDPSWLAGLEDEMARHAVAATAARLALIGRLNAALQGGVVGAFPAAQAALVCPIAERLAGVPALAVEDWLRDGLAANRSRDAAAGSTALGAHRTDLALADAASLTPAALASTGEQKALLIGVILAHASVIAAARGAAPLLLLDEPAVHLDPARRAALFAALASLPAQTLITGTDAETFLPLAGVAEALQTGGGTLRADPRFSAPEASVPPVPPAA
jgi:DNA replication and repair protein RecF